MNNKNYNITDEQIETIRDAAGSAGDLAQCALCSIALGEELPEAQADELGRWMDRTGRAVTPSAADARALVASTVVCGERIAPAYDLTAMLADVARQVGDDGTGDLGIIVRQALADDPDSTVDDIVTIVHEAREDAARERAAQS